MSEHPDDLELLRFERRARQRVDGPIATHLARCGPCRRRLRYVRLLQRAVRESGRLPAVTRGPHAVLAAVLRELAAMPGQEDARGPGRR